MYKSEVIGNGGISSKIVAHSVANNEELITFQLRAPKFLDAEFEKHRMISSNSSSDRAIPFNKLADRDYFLPTDIRMNQAGMQGIEVMSDEEVAKFHEDLIRIHGYTVDILKSWNKVHKQHLNRYLLGFSYQDKVATANRSSFEHFFSLRIHEAADPSMYELARVMKESMDRSEPEELEFGDWHLPYVEKDSFNDYDEHGEIDKFDLESAIKASVARCARVSYLNHDKTQPDIEKDIKLHDMLLESGHFSPFEHVASPMLHTTEIGSKGWWRHEKGYTHSDRKGNLWSGNFRGFLQYRQML